MSNSQRANKHFGRGRTQPVGRSRLAKRATTAAALWELSEQLTSTKFPL